MPDHGRGLKLLVKKAPLHIPMTPWEEHFYRVEELEVPGCWTTLGESCLKLPLPAVPENAIIITPRAHARRG